MRTRCLELKDQIVQAINQYTSGRENYILTSRYLSCMTWEAIAQNISLSSRQVQRICYAAMESVILPKDAIWIVAHGRVA